MKRYTPDSKSKDHQKSRSSKMTPQLLTMDGKNIHLIVGGSKDDLNEPRRPSEKVIIVGGSKDDLDELRTSSENIKIVGGHKDDLDETRMSSGKIKIASGAKHDFDERKKSREKIQSQKMLLLYNTLQKVSTQINTDITLITITSTDNIIYVN